MKIAYEFGCFDNDMFKNDELINIDDVVALNTGHLKHVGKFLLNKEVSYFSIDQWIYYSLYNDLIKGSRAFELKNALKEVKLFNTILSFAEKIEVNTKPIQVENYNKDFVKVDYNLYNWFLKFHTDLVNKLIYLKVLYSSFFLREIIHLIQFPYNISTDWFFEDFEKFKEFAIDFKIEWHLLSFNKVDFDKDFDYWISFRQVSLNYVLYYDGLFVDKMICNKDIPFGNLVYVPEHNIQYEEVVDREIKIYRNEHEPYMSAYDVYMFKVLRVFPRSLNSRFIYRLYQYLLNNLPIPLYLNKTLQENLLNLKEKVVIKNDCVFYEEKFLFIINSSSRINKIKNYCYHKNINSFYLYNCKKLEMVRIRPRVLSNVNFVNVVY